MPGCHRFHHHLGFAVALSILAAGAGNAWALGLGEIRVKSSYNRNFMAVIPVFLSPGESDVKAEVGKQADYTLIQIGRSPLVDSLKLSVENDPERPGEKIIVVTSKEPIAQPSFNLVIRASAGSGSILENYFLAVDFRKSLSLDMPEPEEAKPEAAKPEQKKPVPAPVTVPPPPVHPVAPPAETASIAPPVAQPPVAPPVETASVSPPPKEPEQAKTATSATVPELVKVNAEPSKNILKIRPGDTLFNLARGLNAPKADLSRVVVAIFYANKDSFIGQNIHGLRSGAAISYQKVNELASSITDEEAKNLLDRDWKTWKNTRVQPSSSAVDMSLERPIPAREIADFLENWKKRWVEQSPALADDYSDDFRGTGGKGKAAFLAEKNDILESNANLSVTIGQIKIVRSGAAIVAYFTQELKSDQFAATGQKKMTLKPVPNGLKILDERYKSFTVADSRHVWAVQVASYESMALAQAHIGRLASKGHIAYEGHGFAQSGGGRWAVLAGRLSSRQATIALAKKLKLSGEQGAIVVRFPFSIKLAVCANNEEVAAVMEKAAKAGYSAYPVEMTINGQTQYSVHMGAYAKKTDAQKAALEIKLEGTTPEAAVP